MFDHNINGLIKAIEEGSLDDVMAIVERDGASCINTKDSKGKLPLHQALMLKNKEIAKYLGVAKKLIENGATVNTVGKGNKTPLAIAVEENVELVCSLIAAGARVNDYMDAEESITIFTYIVEKCKEDPEGERLK